MSAVLAVTPGRPRFEELYLEFFPRIYAFLRTQLRHSIDAEDVAAQVFARAYEASPRFRPSCKSPAAWLFKIARNASFDHQRLARRRDRAELAAAEAHGADSDPFTVAEQRASCHRLRLAVSCLPRRQRVALALRNHGLPFREVGNRLGCSEAAAKMLYHRALRVLRPALGVPREPGEQIA